MKTQTPIRTGLLITAVLANPIDFPSEFRSIDGYGNNLGEPTLGAADHPMRRITENAYGDSSSSPAGDDRPSARAVSNFLFGPPGSGGFDLAALNIQRGRDHGLPSYNDTRQAIDLPRARSFRDVNPNRQLQRNLASAFDSVDDIDLWVGSLCEPHLHDAMVGPVLIPLTLLAICPPAAARETFQERPEGNRPPPPQPVIDTIDPNADDRLPKDEIASP